MDCRHHATCRSSIVGGAEAPGSVLCRRAITEALPVEGAMEGKVMTNLRSVAIVVVVLASSAGSPKAQTPGPPGANQPVEALAELQDATVKKYEAALAGGKVPKELLALHARLSDANSAVRIQAVQSLALVGGPMSALLLVRTMDDGMERDSAVRSEAARSLGDIGGRQALETLGIGLADRDAMVRLRVVQALRWAGTVFAVPYIQEALRSDRETGLRLEAVRMLRKIGTQFSVQPLVESLLNDRSVEVRLASADALGKIGKKERQVASFLGEAFRQEKNVGVKLEIVGSFGEVRDRAGAPFLQEAMQDPNLTIRMRATQVYGRVLGLQ